MKAFLLSLAAVCAWAAFSVAADAAPQSGKKRETCQVCDDNPKLLEKAGLVSHGPFEYAYSDTDAITEHFGYIRDLYWLESKHFKIGITLPRYTVPEKEGKAIRAELEELKVFFPSINPRTRYLSPWLRLHLFAYRVEKFYEHFLEIVGKEDKDFDRWESGKYMGEGEFLGQKGKFQLLLFSNKAAYMDFLRTYTGTEHEKPQRHNFIKTDSLWFGCHIQDDQLNRDTNLYSAVIHNVAHNLLDGYKHYSYDVPVWLSEGFAHYAERLVTDEYTSYDFVETFKDFKRNGKSWSKDIRTAVASGKTPALADIMRRLSYSELEEFDHIVIWSLMDYLVKSDPKKFGALLDEMKGRVTMDGKIDAGRLTDAQREALKNIYGLTIQQLEEAWKSWVVSGEPEK